MNLDLLNLKPKFTWKDILWGYEHNYLGWSDVVEYAQKLVSSGNTDEAVIHLSLITKSNLFELRTILEKLASNMEGYYPERWLYFILNDLFHRKHEFEDPLGEVEKIYADFDYPEEIEPFVRYMPPTDGYIPAEHSHEENISRLYANWEKYLTNKI